MKSSITTPATILVMVAVLLCVWCLTGYGEDSRRTELVGQIREKIEKLEQVRSQSREQRAASQQEQQRIDAQISRLRQQLGETRVSLGHKRGHIQTEENHFETTGRENLQQAIAANAAGLQPLISLIETVIQRQPYRERTAWLEQLNRAKAQCYSDDPHEQLAGIQTLFDVVDEIFPYLDAMQLSNEPVELVDGRVVHGYVLRLGMLSSMFVSEDGGALGVAHRNAAGDWLYDLSNKKADAVRTAVAIVRKQAKPALTPVPLQLIKVDGEDE